MFISAVAVVELGFVQYVPVVLDDPVALAEDDLLVVRTIRGK